MPKRGNAARQDSRQGFAFGKDVADNIALKLDRSSDGGAKQSQSPIADVYDAKKMQRGGAGLWRRRRKSRKHHSRKKQMAMPGGGMPQGFGQGAQYGAAPLGMMGDSGAMGG
jgi:hypothetical protein